MKRNRKKVAGIVMLALIGVIFFVIFGVIFYRFYIAGIPVWGCVIAGLAPFISAATITPLIVCAVNWLTD